MGTGYLTTVKLTADRLAIGSIVLASRSILAGPP